MAACPSVIKTVNRTTAISALFRELRSDDPLALVSTHPEQSHIETRFPKALFFLLHRRASLYHLVQGAWYVQIGRCKKRNNFWQINNLRDPERKFRRFFLFGFLVIEDSVKKQLRPVLARSQDCLFFKELRFECVPSWRVPRSRFRYIWSWTRTGLQSRLNNVAKFPKCRSVRRS